MNQRSGVIIGSILLVAALIISINTKVYSMCNDEVFVSNNVYITGCIINPGVVSPGEYIYTVRMAPQTDVSAKREPILRISEELARKLLTYYTDGIHHLNLVLKSKINLICG